jgi:hypothetical protein
MGKAPAAERVFELLAQLYPRDTAAFLGRGACAERQPGGSVRAVQAYEAVLARDPAHFGAHLALAHVGASRGEHQVAVAEYRWCLERRPSDRDALVRFGEALVALDRGDEARLVLEQVAACLDLGGRMKNSNAYPGHALIFSHAEALSSLLYAF